LSIALQKKHVHSDASGRFSVDFVGVTDKLAAKHAELSKTHPAVFANGKMQSGYFPLCPLHAGSKYLAYLLLE